MENFNDVVIVRAVNLVEGTFHEVVTWREYVNSLDENIFQILHIVGCEL